MRENKTSDGLECVFVSEKLEKNKIKRWLDELDCEKTSDGLGCVSRK